MLSIIYRAYPEISKIPILKFKNKDEMLLFCLTSLKEALKEIEFEFIFINDGCTQSQQEIIHSLFRGENFKKIDNKENGNMQSFRTQMLQIHKVKYDKVLILEDDYFINKKDIKLNLDILDDPTIDYSTFFYPLDARNDVGGMKGKTSLHASGLNVTELFSTTLTFFGKRDLIKEDLDYFLTFSLGSHDSSLWLRLTGNFRNFLRKFNRPLFYKNPKLYASIIKRYLVFMLRLNKKSRKLFFCGTGKTTHLDNGAIYDIFSLEKNLIKKLNDLRSKP